MAIAFGVVLWLLRAPLLTAVSRFLIVEEPLLRSDLIYVLNGAVHSRPFHAADLYHRGLAPRVVLPRVETTPGVAVGAYPNQTEAAARILRRLGVPDSAVLILEVPGGVTSTLDEAVALRRYAVHEGLQRVIVVTSAFHTRRSRWTFEQALRGIPIQIIMAPARDNRFHERNWWTNEAGIVAHVEEYLKLSFYILTRRGGSIPQEE